MSCATTAFSLPAGASFDLLARIPDRFPDGHFAGWTPASQVRGDKDELIAELDVEWIDPTIARVLRLRKLDTSAWPVGAARFDVRLTGPDGTRIYTTAQLIYIVRGVTRA